MKYEFVIMNRELASSAFGCAEKTSILLFLAVHYEL